MAHCFRNILGERAFICVYMYAYIYIYRFPCTYSCICIHIYVHTYIHVHVYAHIYSSAFLALECVIQGKNIRCLKLQVIFRKTATIYRALLRNKGSFARISFLQIRHPMSLRHPVLPIRISLVMLKKNELWGGYDE